MSAVGVNVTSMKLEMMTEEDVELRVRLEIDPQMMAELGGPRSREAIERAHAKSLALAVEARCWPLKIIPDGESCPAGGVDVFESPHEDGAIYEIGWMILPEFQNRGIASQAVREVLEKARGCGSSGIFTPFRRSRTAFPTRSVRKTASRTWESARSSSPDEAFAATTGGSICSESGGGGRSASGFGKLFRRGPCRQWAVTGQWCGPMRAAARSSQLGESAGREAEGAMTGLRAGQAGARVARRRQRTGSATRARDARPRAAAA